MCRFGKAIVTIINHANWQPEYNHFSNEGEISWYEFALAIQEIGGFDCEISGISSLDYPTRRNVRVFIIG
jgi:dTDP-4-dehydrorhamnose reductase